MRWLKPAILALAFVVAAVSVSGCNTIRGMGKDIEKGGEKIQDAAQ
jgi:predicted small secreted protein